MELEEWILNYVRKWLSKYLSMNYISAYKRNATVFSMEYDGKLLVRISGSDIWLIILPQWVNMT